MGYLEHAGMVGGGGGWPEGAGDANRRRRTGGPHRQRPGVRESSSEWSERVEGGEEVLTEEGIGGEVAGEDGAVETAVAVGTGEGPACAAPR